MKKKREWISFPQVVMQSQLVFLIIFDIAKTQIMQSPIDLSDEDHKCRMVVHGALVWQMLSLHGGGEMCM